MTREHWEKQASNWATWARTPNFDAYWDYSPAFFDLVPAAKGRTLEVGCGEGDRKSTRLNSSPGYISPLPHPRAPRRGPPPPPPAPYGPSSPPFSAPPPGARAPTLEVGCGE